jgi:hypothetical protein
MRTSAAAPSLIGEHFERVSGPEIVRSLSTCSTVTGRRNCAWAREAMRDLGSLLTQLEEGGVEKLVLTQRNRMRAVVVSVEPWSEVEQALAGISGVSEGRSGLGHQGRARSHAGRPALESGRRRA